jgi:manganese transport protein
MPQPREGARLDRRPQDAGFWRKLFAFAGPGYLVAVGMDPGNWAADLAGGARYGSLERHPDLEHDGDLQALAVRLGIATGRDLAQACHDSYSKPVTIVLGPVRSRLRPAIWRRSSARRSR